MTPVSSRPPTYDELLRYTRRSVVEQLSSLVHAVLGKADDWMFDLAQKEGEGADPFARSPRLEAMTTLRSTRATIERQFARQYEALFDELIEPKQGSAEGLHLSLVEEQELEQQLATWETEIGAVMPPDFKDWHQNAKSEHPIVARSVIESLSKSEAQAWDHLTSALTPRPIAEAGPVKDGVVRLFSGKVNAWVWSDFCQPDDTHFIDIKLPSPDPRAEYERAVAKAGGAFEAWLQAKGGLA
jgi:hypothetical protein